MGDKVWFATSNRDTLSTPILNARASSGFNGFPFPVPTGAWVTPTFDATEAVWMDYEEWDGSTYYQSDDLWNGESGSTESHYSYTKYPSNSASQRTPVVGDLTGFIKLTIEEAVEVCWRIRGFTMTGGISFSSSVSADDISSSGTFSTSAPTNTPNVSITGTPRELDLIGNLPLGGSFALAPSPIWDDSLSFYLDDKESDSTDHISLNGSSPFGWGWASLSSYFKCSAFKPTGYLAVKDDPDHIYVALPRLTGQYEHTGFSSNLGNPYSIVYGHMTNTKYSSKLTDRITGYPEERESQTSQLVGVSVLGRTVHYPITPIHVVGGQSLVEHFDFDFSFEVTGSTLELQPHSYWPYDAGQDGDKPIFDTDTGERLRNPLTGAVL